MPKYSKKMDGWADALKDRGYSKLAGQLITDMGNRGSALKVLEEMRLPTYRHAVVSADRFLEDPESILSGLSSDTYYITLLPKKPELQRYSKSGLTAEETVDFVKFHASHNLQDYDVLLQEFETNSFGGTIISNEDCIHVELCKGKQSEVAYGTAQVMTATRGRFSPSFRYSVDDTETRGLIWGALQFIRERDEAERQTQVSFAKGYFEFAITQSSRGMRFVFFDYNKSPSYTSLGFSGAL